MAKISPFSIRRRVEKTDQHWGVGQSIPRTTRANIKSTHWHGTDSLEAFEKNKPAGWTEDSISYAVNKQGYRSMEFVDDGNFTVASYGCSMTMGVGVPVEYTWPEIFCKLLQKQTGNIVNNFNLGWGGSSTDHICRTLFCAVPVLKPNLVLMYLPDMYRRETYDSEGYATRMIPTNKVHAEYYEKYANHHEAKNNFLKNLMFMKTVLELHGIPWLFATWDQDMKKEVFKEKTYVDGHRYFNDDWARDCSHPSIKSYTYLASSFLKKYNELYT